MHILSKVDQVLNGLFDGENGKGCRGQIRVWVRQAKEPMLEDDSGAVVGLSN